HEAAQGNVECLEGLHYTVGNPPPQIDPPDTSDSAWHQAELPRQTAALAPFVHCHPEYRQDHCFPRNHRARKNYSRAPISALSGEQDAGKQQSGRNHTSPVDIHLVEDPWIEREREAVPCRGAQVLGEPSGGVGTETYCQNVDDDETEGDRLWAEQ